MLKTIQVHEDEEKLLGDILNEYDRQIALRRAGKFWYTCEDSPGLSPSLKLGVLMEEVGEVARAILNMNGSANDMTIKEAEVNLRTELVQVAAVAFAWLKGIENDTTKT